MLTKLHQLTLVARSRLGINQVELASRLGRSQGFVSKLEAGLVELDDGDIEQLAEALDVPAAFFGLDQPIYPQTLSFHRSRKKTSKVEIDRVWAEHNMLRFTLSRLLRSVERRYEHDLPQYDLEDVKDPGKAAQFTRAALGLPPGPVRHLVEIVERAGVVVVGYDFRTEAIDAVSHVASGDLPHIVFLNTRASGDRLRFSLAHELGHLVLHRYPTTTMEDEANEFAGEFLMPAGDIGPVLRNKLDVGVLGSLKSVWGCSMQAIAFRARTLDAMSPSQYKRLMVTMAPYRLVEPHPVLREVADALPALWQFHMDRLGWSFQDLQEFVPLPIELFHRAIGLPSLSIVRTQPKPRTSALSLQ